MRPIIKITICAIIAAATAAPAVAAADFFLKLDGPIKGESSDRILNPVPRDGGKKVEITSWSWGASNAGTAKVTMHDMHISAKATTPDATSQGLAVSDPGASGPKTTSKRQHGSVTITKPLDRGSVTVNGNLPGCTVGAAYAGAVLQTTYIRYELKEVMISSCTVSGGGGGGATESVTLDYASYRESPTRQTQK